MCLGIPGEVVTIDSTPKADYLRCGKVKFGGIYREVNLGYVPEVNVGDYVIVHVGFAISIVDKVEAERIFDHLKQIEGLEELDTESGVQL